MLRNKTRTSTQPAFTKLLVVVAAILAISAPLAGARASRGDAAATAAGTTMVKDINPTGNGFPYFLAVFNGSLYFEASDGVPGSELWKSDGTAAGTTMVANINPAGNGFLYFLTVFNGSLYFGANDGVHGYELWKSDGTAAGAAMAVDINPTGDSNPSYLTVFNGSLYFQASDGVRGYELWKSDGTAAGTAMVADINPTGASDPRYLTVLNDSLYFAADDGVHGYELWKSDGTADGTAMVKDINPSGENVPYSCCDADSLTSLTAFNGSLYFKADDGVHGNELWKSDGTADGTAMVKDINPTLGSEPNFFAVFNGSLYFEADDGVHGNELWKSDGTAAGTTMAVDINPTGTSNPYGLTVFNGSLYFGAGNDVDGDVNGSQLWKSDGTAAGTAMVKDINPTGNGDPYDLTVFNGSLYFGADDGVHGYELWKSDGTVAATTQITSGPSAATSDSTPTFTFSSDEPGSFECAIGGGGYSVCSSPKTVGPLADGTHTFWVRVIDQSGTVNASPTERVFTIDTTALDTQITSGPPALTRKNAATFSFSSPEASAVFECSLDDAGWTACVSPKTYSGLSDGRHIFNVRAKDQLGNAAATPSSRAFTIDTRASQTRIAKHPKKTVRMKKAKVTARFTFRSSEKGSRFSCKLDEGKWKSCRSPKVYRVKPGKHTFRVRATDRAGNTNRTPAKSVWRVKRVRSAHATQVSAGTASATKISAHLTSSVFTSSQAGSVKLIYRFSKPSKRFSYLLTFKQGSKWQTVKSVKKKGHFKGSKSMTVKKLFAGKPVRVGSYRLKLSVDKGRKLLGFRVVRAPSLSAGRSLSAGGSHTCDLLSDGTVKCWGNNENGQLGVGGGTKNIPPVQVKGVGGVGTLSNVTQISAGLYHTCASLTGGAVECWGWNSYGQLGNGATTDSSTPVQVTGIASATAISAGNEYACALLSGGTVECWGWNNYGQLGNGSTTDSSTPVQVKGVGGVGTLSNVTQISAGDYDSCALSSAGTVRCWGRNNYGQLGDGTATNRTTPVRVRGITTATAVSAGLDHTCALLSGGTVKCWGYNGYGQLGNGTTTDSSTPVTVRGITTATAIDAGRQHTCALLSGGTIKCWGLNNGGQLGDGTYDNSSTPVQVTGITTATAVSAGRQFTCALLSGGTVKCWGVNYHYQLGSRTEGPTSTPVSVIGVP